MMLVPAGPTPTVSVEVKPPDQTIVDAVEVFQRAFWKRPTADDKILHAERREWSDANGISNWQWFIAVETSSALRKHLREDNAFSLIASADIQPPPDAPTWFRFPTESMDALHAAHGRMTLWFAKTSPVLFATDSGAGFRPGAAEPGRAGATTSSSLAETGRLPLTSPPLPQPSPSSQTTRP